MNLHKSGRAMVTLAVMACLLVAMWPAGIQAQESEWERQNVPASGTLYGVWGSSGSDVFVVGRFGTILHYDGYNWSVMDSGTDVDLFAVWGSSATDVFAVGYCGTILHYDGTSWSPMDSGAGSLLFNVWGSSGTDVFAVDHDGGNVLHYDGYDWSPDDLAAELYGVWGSSGTDVFVTGHSGAIFHYDGTIWSPMNSGTTDGLVAVWGSSGSDVFAVGDNGTILHYDGTSWSDMDSGMDVTGSSVWGSSGTDVYAVGGDGERPAVILHYNGMDWSAVNSGTVDDRLFGVWGSGSNDVYAVGGDWDRPGVVLHYSGPVKIVSVDIKPDSHRNSIQCENEQAIIAVAILTDEEFDATTVNHTTVTFEGASEIHVRGASGEAIRHETDVDGDGDTDLLFHFRLGDTSLSCESTAGTLRGETFDALAIRGTDTVRMIDPGPFVSPLLPDG